MLRDLWNVASEEERHVIANMMVKLVQMKELVNKVNPERYSIFRDSFYC